MKLSDFVFQDTGGHALPLKVWRKITAGSVTLKMPDDVKWVFVRMIGGGGAGGHAGSRYGVALYGGGGGGGGAGMYAETVVPVTPGLTYPCVVGGPGGRSSFAGIIVSGGASGGHGQAGRVSDSAGLLSPPSGGRGGGRGNNGSDGGSGHGDGGLGEIPANSFYIHGDVVVLGSGGAGGSSGKNQDKGYPGVRGFVEITYRSTGEIVEA